MIRRVVYPQLKAVQLIKQAEIIVYDDLGTQVALPAHQAVWYASCQCVCLTGLTFAGSS